MKEKYSLFLLPLFSLLFFVLFTGCATIQTTGTYPVKSEIKSNMSGNSAIYGTVRYVQNFTEVLGFDPYNNSPVTFGEATEVEIEPGNLKIKSDESGNFTVNNLKPGDYSIYYNDMKEKQKRTDVTLLPDQQLNIIIYTLGHFPYEPRNNVLVASHPLVNPITGPRISITVSRGR